MVVFQTERLRAVRWRHDHAAPAFAAYSRPEFVRYLAGARPHPDLDHTHRWIDAINARYDDPAAPVGFWALEQVDSGAVVGATICQPLPGGDGEHEIGWHVFPAHQRLGYAVESGRGAAGYGFDVLGLDEVFAIVMPDNAASLAVARAVGMRHLGRTSRYYGLDAELFSLSRDDIRAAAPASRRP